MLAEGHRQLLHPNYPTATTTNKDPSASKNPKAAAKRCIVCFVTFPIPSFPSEPFSPQCNHRGQTCVSCLRDSINYSLRSTLPFDIPCPECPATVSEDTIQRYADPETIQRYEDLRLQRLLEADRDFVWCAAGCGNGQLHAGGSSQPIVTCDKCQKKTCFSHKCAWHAGVTCEEWDSVLQEESQIAKNGSQSSPATAKQPPARTHTDPELLERIQRERDNRASETHIQQSGAKQCPKCLRWIDKIDGWWVVSSFS
ncbi:hypothetical protein QBC43DRAFT_220049 [Cladorrhinum sp. PSN259]|nr:hypothetical protein QBC43DRAFT_220049 [Cladorrhinum sp. PSN259]